jgi:ribonuclease P protein component
MIKKKFRLSGEEIKKFFEQNYFKISNKNFLIYYRDNKLEYPRFAILPKKEIFKEAVKRNKIRRQIYAIIRELLNKGKIKNCDFFIIVQKQENNFKKIKEFLINLILNV